VTAYGADPTEPPPRAVMLHRWDRLTFLHWRYDAATVQALLPRGLAVETYDGSAWVGLVPFEMTVRAARGPALPWLSRFPETNVRTYVTGPDGRTGVWFLSLDAARLPAVVTARQGFRLPYYWSRMRVQQEGGTVRYDSHRRWPGPRRRSTVEVEVGGAFDGLTGLDHFLTARFALWTVLGRGPARAQAHHPAWPLRRVAVRTLDDELVTAAGLPAPRQEPLAHYSDGVEVLIGLPRRP
jgi:hypothetical protein